MPRYARVKFNPAMSSMEEQTVIVQDADIPKLDAIVAEVNNTRDLDPKIRTASPVMVETMNAGGPAWPLHSRTIATIKLLDR